VAVNDLYVCRFGTYPIRVSRLRTDIRLILDCTITIISDWRRSLRTAKLLLLLRYTAATADEALTRWLRAGRVALYATSLTSLEAFFRVSEDSFPPRSNSVAKEVLFSVASVCQCVNSKTIWDIPPFNIPQVLWSKLAEFEVAAFLFLADDPWSGVRTYTPFWIIRNFIESRGWWPNVVDALCLTTWSNPIFCFGPI